MPDIGTHESWTSGMPLLPPDPAPRDETTTLERFEQDRARHGQRGRAICEEALSTINGARQDQYGNPEDTFTQIAALWEAYLGTKVTPPMVADMMCLLKIAREKGGQGKKDNMVDLIGYAALGASMRGYDA